MTPRDDLISQFALAMEGLLHKAVGVAKVSATRLMGAVREQGAFQVARDELNWRFVLPGQTLKEAPPYFRALRNRNRLDLSIECLILEPQWGQLFSKDEKEAAVEHLRSNGYVPSEAVLARMFGDQRANTHNAASPTTVDTHGSSNALAWVLWYLEIEDLPLCEQMARVNGVLQEVWEPRWKHRVHLQDCAECRARYGNLVSAYSDYDRRQWDVLAGLIRQTSATLNTAEKEIEDLVSHNSIEPPEDLDPDTEGLEEERECLREEVKSVLAWRALLLAQFTGRWMANYAATYPPTEGWVAWRRDGMQPVSSFLRGLNDQEYRTALTARNVDLMVRFSQEEPMITLPSAGKLSEVDGALRVETTLDLLEWTELLGSPPECLKPYNVLWFAFYASGEMDKANKDDIPDQIQSLEKRVSRLDRGSREQAEESLRAILGGTYSRLVPPARLALIAAEQIYMKRDFALPSQAVYSLVKAFENQMTFGLLPQFRSYLGGRGISQWPPKELMQPNQKAILPQARWRPGLGDYSRAFERDPGEFRQFCRAVDLDCEGVKSAISKVQPRRNPEVHEEGFSATVIEAIREEWLGSGGVFAALLSDEQA